MAESVPDTLVRSGPRRTLSDGSQRSAVAPLARGAEVGRYLILGRLGAGGMGTVYAAHDPELDRKVAIKVLFADDISADNRSARARRILREGRALAKLRDPHIVAVYDVGRKGDDVFIAMEHVSGQTLHRWATAQEHTVLQVVEHYLAAGRGLAAAHEAGIVHGDFKPENVMLDDNGRLVVLDFGLASGATQPGPDPAALEDSDVRTQAGAGTPAYMAPEQHLARQPTAASDQFALCVALYEAICGRRPFPGNTPAALADAVLHEPPRSPSPRMPRWLWSPLKRGLHVDPSSRHPSVSALLTAIDPSRRRRRQRRIVAAVAAVGVVGIGLGSLFRDAPEPCGDAPAELGPAWNGDVQARLEARFAHASAWPPVRSAIERFASAWTAQWGDACRATRVSGSQSESTLGLRMACLDRYRGRLQILTTRLTAGDEKVLQRAANEIDSALDLGTHCADIDALHTRTPPPSDPDRNAAFQRALDVAAQADARTRLDSQPEAALAILDAVQADVDALQHPVSTGAVAVARADAMSELRRYADAGEHYQSAMRAAESARDDNAAVMIASSYAFVLAIHLQDVAAGEIWLLQAQNRLQRLRPTPHQRAVLLLREGTIRRVSGAPLEAIEAFGAGLEFAPEHAPSLRGTLRNNLGNAYVDQGEMELGATEFRRAVELRTSGLGPDHIDVARSRLNLARVLMELGSLLEADTQLGQAVEVFEASGEAPRERVGAVEAQAILAAMQGDAERAIHVVDGAIEIANLHLPDGDRSHAGLQLNRARMLMMEGRLNEARTAAANSLRLEEDRRGATDSALVLPLSLLGEIELQLHHPAATIRHTRRAEALATSDEHRVRMAMSTIAAQIHLDCDLGAAARTAQVVLDRFGRSDPTPALEQTLDELRTEAGRWQNDPPSACR